MSTEQDPLLPGYVVMALSILDELPRVRVSC